MLGAGMLRALLFGRVRLVLMTGFGVVLDRGADLGRHRRIFGLADGGGFVMVVVIVVVIVGFVRGLGCGRFRRLVFRPIARHALAGRDVSRLVRHFVGGERIALHGFVGAGVRPLAAAVAAAGAAAAARMVFGFIVVTRSPRVGVDQGLPVGDRNLVIVRMDFGKRQEAVAVAAVLDEGRLQRGFDPRYLGEIDIAAKLFAVRGLEIEFLDAVAAQHDHPSLLRMCRVDKHLIGH